MSNGKNPAISIARVFGMLSIVLCHTIIYYTFIPGHNYLNQIFGVGVHLFIFISGYLYGGKVIQSFGKWYAQRFFVVSFPAIIASCIIMVALLIKGTPITINTFAVYFLDLEGVLFLNNNVLYFYSEITSLGHLWFTTIIMLCYLLVAVLQKIAINSHSSLTIVKTLVLLIAGTGVCFVAFPFINLTFFFLFIIGYFFGKVHFLDCIRIKTLAVSTVLFISALIGRLLLRHYADGTIVYTFYVQISNFILGIWPVIVLAFLYKKMPRVVNGIAEWRVIRWFDKYSFYIYLTHGIFCAGDFNLYNLFSLPLATIIFSVLVILGAISLKWLCDFASKPILKQLKS